MKRFLAGNCSLLYLLKFFKYSFISSIFCLKQNLLNAIKYYSRLMIGLLDSPIFYSTVFATAYLSFNGT